MALPRLGTVRLAERAQVLLRPAIGDHALELGKRDADGGELRLGLPAAADQAQAARAAPREVPCGDPARRAGAQLAELVRVDHGDELRRVGTEEQDHKAGALAEAGVDLRAREHELEVDGGHHGERPVLEPQPVARPVLDPARGHAAEARLDRLDGVRRGEEPGDVGLGQVERHSRILAAGTEKCARLSCARRDRHARGGLRAT